MALLIKNEPDPPQTATFRTLVPISFVSDQLETLYELDIEYRVVAEGAGIENYIVMQGLNDSDIFISAWRDIVLYSLNLIDS